MRAIGIVRVSDVAGRQEGNGFESPEAQREGIARLCEREGLTLSDVHQELDVSGKTPLDRRKGLSQAIEAVEQGQADVVVVAYFDRLVRSLEVQAQILSRVENAGGRVIAADLGEISNGTAAKWLSSTLLGAMNEYFVRITGEKSREAQHRAAQRGIPPMILPEHLSRDGDTIVMDERLGQAIGQAVRMRAEGQTIDSIRAYLAEHGIERSRHGVQHLLRSPLLYGVWTFTYDKGTPREHMLSGTVPACIDEATWRKAQAVSIPRGARSKTPTLLGRLGILRCGTCGARLVTGTTRGVYRSYRCPTPRHECQDRPAISGNIMDSAVEAAVKELAAGIKGEGDASSPDYQTALDMAQKALDEAIATFAAAGLLNEPSAVKELTTLRETRDSAQMAVEAAVDRSDAKRVVVTADDWDKLTLDEKRDLIVALIERIDVYKTGSAERFRIFPR